jgi:hypothetical protein
MPDINPSNTDAILGGQNPPPVDAAVLGGEIGKKQRLQHEQAIARANKFWQNFEYLNGLPDRHATIFADRQVVNFELGMEIFNPKATAYALREERGWWYSANRVSIQDRWYALLQDPRANEVEALVFGYGICGFDYIRFLVENHQWFDSLKALFLGDIEDREQMISELSFGKDISQILSVYPDLEILQIRCGGYSDSLYFSEWWHDRLKTLRIESGGLNRNAIIGLCQLDLPALEYLELWTGSEEYGSTSSVEDLIPILSGEKFPKLKFLGIKNCEYTNEVVSELVKSPLLESTIELDLSMGTLDMEGFSTLIRCPRINDLDKINLTRNFLEIRQNSPNAFHELSQVHPEILNLKCELIVNNQRFCYPDISNRYCSLRE